MTECGCQGRNLCAYHQGYADGSEVRYDHFLFWRGIRSEEDACETCQGSGLRVYSSTATWHGGIGGAAMTRDVCDKCWGSGDKTRPGLNQREWFYRRDREVAERAATLFEDRMGIAFKDSRLAVAEIQKELARLARGRKPRPWFFYDMCGALSRLLQDLIDAKDPKNQVP